MNNIKNINGFWYLGKIEKVSEITKYIQYHIGSPCLKYDGDINDILHYFNFIEYSNKNNYKNKSKYVCKNQKNKNTWFLIIKQGNLATGHFDKNCYSSFFIFKRKKDYLNFAVKFNFSKQYNVI